MSSPSSFAIVSDVTPRARSTWEAIRASLNTLCTECGYPRQNLMHELLHVAKYSGLRAHMDDGYQGRNPFEYQDHDFIVSAAPEVLLLLRRNPKLTAWLTDPEYKEAWE